MAPKINVYAWKGVNVDRSPVHLEDGELTSAQNAVLDVQGHEGGVRKRPGLARFNSSAGAGSIYGGVGVPLALLANAVGGTSLAGGATRKVFFGRQATDAVGGASRGWWTSTDKFATAATVVEDGSPADPRSNDQVRRYIQGSDSFHLGSPAASCVVRNRLIYASDGYTVGTNTAPIRAFDGTVDQEIARVTPGALTAAVNSYGVLSMLAVGETVYMTVFSATDTSTTQTGVILSLNPSTGAIAEVGTISLTSRHVPYCLAWHMGRLWVGTQDHSAAGPGKIYWIRPGIDTSWTLDRTMGSGTGCTSLTSFQGQLFAGGRYGAVDALVEVRSSIGTWSTSLTIASASASNYLGAAVFEGNLYLSHYTPTGDVSLIKKFDGSSWSTVLSGTSKPLTYAWIDDTHIYFGGAGDALDGALYTSPDGAAWTDRSANLTTGFMGLGAVGVLSL